MAALNLFLLEVFWAEGKHNNANLQNMSTLDMYKLK